MAAQKHTRKQEPRPPEYRIWLGMRNRCLDPNRCQYGNYGGRGIKVCDRWANSFAAFLDDMGRRPSPDLSLDRVDNDRDYEPGNCRWATRSEQQRNKRENRILEFDGQRRTVAEWVEVTGIAFTTIVMRIARGWEVGDALTIPARAGQKPYRILKSESRAE